MPQSHQCFFEFDVKLIKFPRHLETEFLKRTTTVSRTCCQLQRVGVGRNQPGSCALILEYAQNIPLLLASGAARFRQRRSREAQLKAYRKIQTGELRIGPKRYFLDRLGLLYEEFSLR